MPYKDEWTLKAHGSRSRKVMSSYKNIKQTARFEAMLGSSTGRGLSNVGLKNVDVLSSVPSSELWSFGFSWNESHVLLLCIIKCWQCFRSRKIIMEPWRKTSLRKKFSIEKQHMKTSVQINAVFNEAVSFLCNCTGVLHLTLKRKRCSVRKCKQHVAWHSGMQESMKKLSLTFFKEALFLELYVSNVPCRDHGETKG